MNTHAPLYVHLREFIGGVSRTFRYLWTRKLHEFSLLGLDAGIFQLVGCFLMRLHGSLGSSGSFTLALTVLGAFIVGIRGLFLIFDPSPLDGTQQHVLLTEQAQSAAAFIDSVGVNAHLSYLDTAYGNFARVEDDLRSLGIRNIREGVHLGNSDSNNLLFGRWIALGKMGVRFDAVLDPREKLGPMTPALIQRIEQLSGNTIESFEGPNELDINLPNWVEVDRGFEKSIFDSVQSASAAQRTEVIAPSLAFASKGKEFGGKLMGFDEGNLHSYPGGKMPSAIFPEQIELARSVFGDKPIVMTESGYHNGLNDHSDQPGVPEPIAAKYIPRLFLENFCHHIPRTYLYELFDEKPDPALSNNQWHWGLVRFDGSEKPAFVALKNLLHELNDNGEPSPPLALSWALSTSGPAIHHLLLKKSNGQFDLILWQEVSSYNTWIRHEVHNDPMNTTLLLGKEARQVVLYEPVVQAAPIRTYTKVTRVPVSIPDRPLVIEIEPE